MQIPESSYASGAAPVDNQSKKIDDSHDCHLMISGPSRQAAAE
jgi:hypothetical protein